MTAPWAGACNVDDTAAFAASHEGHVAPGHFRRSEHLLRAHAATTEQERDACAVMLSSLGIGTYLGRADYATDAAVTSAVLASVGAGWNVIDSAINYRHERGERAIGARAPARWRFAAAAGED